MTRQLTRYTRVLLAFAENFYDFQRAVLLAPKIGWGSLSFLGSGKLPFIGH